MTTSDVSTIKNNGNLTLIECKNYTKESEALAKGRDSLNTRIDVIESTLLSQTDFVIAHPVKKPMEVSVDLTSKLRSTILQATKSTTSAIQSIKERMKIEGIEELQITTVFGEVLPYLNYVSINILKIERSKHTKTSKL